jgi:SNF2 family DNA or RNA helicase
MAEKLKPQELEVFKDALPFKLHDWQWADVLTAQNYDRFGLFLPVGSGKTVIATLVALGWNDPHVIVILPPILIFQWVKWLNSIPASGGALAFKGAPKIRHNLPIEDFKWLVMSLDVFKNDSQLLESYFAGKEVTTIVDEAQCLRTPSSQNFKKVQSFSAGKKLLLATGTELNNPGDAYAYIKLKTTSLYRSRVHFDNMHVAERDFFEKPIKWQDTETLSRNLYLQAAKRTKEEVHAHLPKATYTPIEYELEPTHKKLYDKLVDEMLLELPTGGKIDATTASALYNKSQQIIVNWNDFAGETELRPAVFDVIDQVCDEIDFGKPGASKLILWTWFKRTTEAVLAYMNSKYPSSAVAAYSGADSVKSVARFLDDPSCLCLVGQPGSVGMGLNPQHLCWESLFIEAPTRSIPFKQAAGRIDRDGQRYNPTIRVAMAAGTIQCSMFRNLLANDAEVTSIQSEKDLRAAIYGN